MNYLQQGDVLLFKVKDQEIVGGETTIIHKGDIHCHRATSLVVIKDDFISVKTPTLMIHDEHRPILLSVGTYQKRIVYECDPVTQIKRQVID